METLLNCMNYIHHVRNKGLVSFICHLLMGIVDHVALTFILYTLIFSVILIMQLLDSACHVKMIISTYTLCYIQKYIELLAIKVFCIRLG